MRNIKHLAVIAAAIALQPAWAATNDTASFDVTATVASECVVGSTTNMTFGRLQMLNADSGGLDDSDATKTASFDAACTNGTGSPQLSFSSPNALEQVFRLKKGADYIEYSLYQGETTTALITPGALADFAGFAADGVLKSLKVTGKIEAAAKNGAKVGDYSDTVTITVGFTPN